MNRFALLTLYRSLSRHKLYAALNIGGLAVGIAVFLILSLYVRFEKGYETWLPGHDRLYLVQTEFRMPGRSMTVPASAGPLFDGLKADYPDVQGTRILPVNASVIRGGIGTAEKLARVDGSFLDVFALPIARGTATGALADPSNLLIDQTMAKKYFPGTDPIGKQLTLGISGVTATYTVAAVFADLPKDTDFAFDMVAPLPARSLQDWDSANTPTYLRFATPAAARSFSSRFPDLFKRHAPKEMWSGPGGGVIHYSLQPLTDQHFQAPGRKVTVTTLGIVGLLALLVSVVNYVNLATARAGMRAREVAMRKVLGADRATLIRQFLGEAVLTVMLAALIGLIIVELALPAVNAAGGLSLSIPYVVVMPALAGLALVVGVIAGFYPALLLSRFPAAAVLASARSPGGGRFGMRVREALVVVQFALTIAFIIGTLVLGAQTRHVRLTDLGFQRDGLLIVGSFGDTALTEGQRASLLAAFRTIPTIRSVGIANNAPGTDTDSNSTLAVPGQGGAGVSLSRVEVGPDFFATYGVRPIAGRLFDGSHRLDDGSDRPYGDLQNIVINRRAASALGFASPNDAIGKTIGGGASPRTIVGVVENLRFFSPRDPIRPTFYPYFTHGLQNPILALRFSGDPGAAMTAVRTTWRRLVPQVSFEAKTASQTLSGYYESDDRATRLFGIGASLAVLIGCVGLWGLASFNTARRVREIGIRKVLGASSADIVRLLVGQFLRPVLVANLIGWPVAYFAMRTWLAGFDDRIALSPIYFIGASLVAIVIAVLTVLAQSLRASRAAPAWALRHE